MSVSRIALLFAALWPAMAQRPIPIDNDWARVIVATSQPGPKGAIHKHDVNRVMIYLDKGAQRLEFQSGETKEIPFIPGDVKWDQKGGMHTSENRGGTTFRVVEIELKKPGGTAALPADDPVKVAPGSYSVELENSQVRVLRVKLGPRQKVGIHEHGGPRILVPLTAVDLQVMSTEGKQSRLTAKPGDAVFGGAARHSEQSLLDTPTELILIELKG